MESTKLYSFCFFLVYVCLSSLSIQELHLPLYTTLCKVSKTRRRSLVAMLVAVSSPVILALRQNTQVLYHICSSSTPLRTIS